jgi:hypothetical protein
MQLVHNEWNPVTKSSRMRVAHSFDREDQLDRAAVKRLAGLLSRLVGSGTGLGAGGQLWQQLGISQIMIAMTG